MSGIVNKLASISEGIAQIPVKVVEGIIDGLMGIFIPDKAFIQDSINTLSESVQCLGVKTYDMSSIFTNEKPFNDIKCTILGRECVIVNMSFIDNALDTFRPVIRGLLWLLMLFYNYNQFMGIIGQQGIMLGNVVSVATAEKGKE